MASKPHKAVSALTRELWINAGAAVLKGAAGLMSGSAALLADGIRSAAEAARSFVSASGLRAGGEPGRAAAPIHGGAGSVESGVNVAAAMLFLVAGLETAIAGVREIAAGRAGTVHWAAPAVVVLIFALRVLLDRRINRLEAGAAAVAAVGTGAAWLGGAFGLPLLEAADPAASVVIAVLVMLRGYRFVSGSLTGTARVGFREEETAELKNTATIVDGVIAVEELRAWEQGRFVVVDMVVSVNPRITVLEGQEIAKRTKELLMKRFLHLTDVFVRVDPYDPGYPYKSNHDVTQEQTPTLLQ